MPLVALIGVACNGQAQGKRMVQPLGDVIERFRATGAWTLVSVEHTLGATLNETEDSNASFAFYEARRVKIGDHLLDVELRTPVPGGAATSGALLVLNVTGPCVRRDEIEAAYGPLTLTQTPRGRSTDDEAQWSRQENWGRLSFGFPERARDCLGSIVFAAASR